MPKGTVAGLFLTVCLITSLEGRSLRADERSEARGRYERGTAMFDLGKYLDAAHEYEAAYELKNDPALLFNIGQAYRQANDPAAALRAYRAYLRRSATPSNHAEVEARIAELEHVVDMERQAVARPPTEVLKPTAPASEPVPSAPPPEAATTSRAPGPVAAVRQQAPPARTPLHKKWWLWTAVGVVAVGLAVGVSLAATTPNNVPTPAGAIPIRF